MIARSHHDRYWRAGVAVNNAIVLIDYTNQLRSNGFAGREAVVLTFLTLVVVPTLYFLLEQGKENLVLGKNRLDRKRRELYSLLSGESA